MIQTDAGFGNSLERACVVFHPLASRKGLNLHVWNHDLGKGCRQ